MSRYMPQYPSTDGPPPPPFGNDKQFIDKFGPGDTLSKFSVDGAKQPQRGTRQRSLDEDEVDAELDNGHDPANNLDASQTSALTSQTLNTDGTPKRPMNAFMIFARRRRPQVSSENQAMRTGEISKILSREWNTMEGSEKQFYLDQAKQLKENFNAKYPDYVYRRRPNNSRKRRKPDGSLAGRANNVGPPGRDIDDAGGNDMSEPSPSDHGEDDHHAPPHHPFSNSGAPRSDYPYSSGGSHTQHSTSSARYNTSYGGPSGNPNYLDHEPGSGGGAPSRFSYSGGGPPPGSNASDRRLSQPPPFSASSTSSSSSRYQSNYSHSPSLYNPANSNDRGGPWPGDRPRSSSNSHSWPGQGQPQNQDRTLAKPFYNSHSHSHSPVDGANGPSGPGTSGHHNPTNDTFQFPTLTSPFFPESGGNASSAPGGPAVANNNSSSNNPSSNNAYPPPSSSVGLHHRAFDSRNSYSASSPGGASLSPVINPYPSSGAGPGPDHLYPRGGGPGMGRVLPPIASYPTGPGNPGGPSPSNGPGDYWGKDKDEH